LEENFYNGRKKQKSKKNK